MGLSTQTSYHQPPLSSIGIDTKYNPAYEGARFDTSGYCLKHPMIRLCKPAAPSNNNASTTTSHLLSLKKKSPKDESFDESPASSSNGSEEGDDSAMPKFKYIIIRKTCPMCGEHNLRNERKMNRQVGVAVSLDDALQLQFNVLTFTRLTSPSQHHSELGTWIRNAKANGAKIMQEHLRRIGHSSQVRPSILMWKSSQQLPPQLSIQQQLFKHVANRYTVHTSQYSTQRVFQLFTH